jgi:hypothetical protein
MDNVVTGEAANPQKYEPQSEQKGENSSKTNTHLTKTTLLQPAYNPYTHQAPHQLLTRLVEKLLLGDGHLIF